MLIRKSKPGVHQNHTFKKRLRNTCMENVAVKKKKKRIIVVE